MSGEVIAIQEITGPTGAPVFNEVTSIRFCSANDHNDGLVHPCKVPPTGVEAYYSFVKTLCLAYSGTFSDISNARFWGPGNIKTTWFVGTPATGRMVMGRKDTGDHGFLYTAYEAPGGTVGTTGIGMKTALTGHSQFNTQTIAVADVDTLTQVAPLVFDSRHITGAGYSKCLALQTEILPTADHGDQTPITLVLAVEVV
jgi:hypothetical protein